MSDDDIDWGDDGDEDFGDDDGDGGWGDTTLVNPDDVDVADEADTGASGSACDEYKGNEQSDVDKRYRFAPMAFGKLRARSLPEGQDEKLSAALLQKMMVETVPGVQRMRSTTRDPQPVMDMLCRIYQGGLFTLGDASSPVNRQVIPSLQHIFGVCRGLAPQDPKRKNLLRTLTDAMNDCQQVQAREILRLFGDLTNQTQTFEGQIQYFLLKQKEEGLERFIGKYHKDCDQPHTVVEPHQQRAHLKSGYIDMLGDQLGLEAVEAAKADRFLPKVKKEILNGVWGDVDNSIIFKMLCKELSVHRFINGLLSDINNQSGNADRLINRDVIFNWVKANLSLEKAHEVFWSSDREGEYREQTPNKPGQENQFQPFLSFPFLTDVLLNMGFIELSSMKPT